MDKSHIFIVRVRAGRQPEHACHVTVREIEAEEATTVPTADELWASMLSALKPVDARVASGDSPPAAVIAPCTDRPDVGFFPGTASVCARTASRQLSQ